MDGNMAIEREIKEALLWKHSGRIGFREMGKFCVEDGSLAKAATADGLGDERRRSQR